MAVNKEGHIFVAEWGGHCVSVFTEEGTFQYRFGHKGKAEGEFNHPTYILITPDDLVYVTDGHNDRIQVFQQNGQFIRQFATPYGRFNPISVTSWTHCPSCVKMLSLLALNEATTICPLLVTAIPFGSFTMPLPNCLIN